MSHLPELGHDETTDTLDSDGQLASPCNTVARKSLRNTQNVPVLTASDAISQIVKNEPQATGAPATTIKTDNLKDNRYGMRNHLLHKTSLTFINNASPCLANSDSLHKSGTASALAHNDISSPQFEEISKFNPYVETNIWDLFTFDNIISVGFGPFLYEATVPKVITTSGEVLINVGVTINCVGALLPPMPWKVIALKDGTRCVLFNAGWKAGDKGLAHSRWAPKA